MQKTLKTSVLLIESGESTINNPSSLFMVKEDFAENLCFVSEDR